MFTNYNEFINEGKKILTPEDYGINGVKDDYGYPGYVNVISSNVNLRYFGLKKIPFSFGKVSGGFSLDNNKLKDLKGCPKYIGDFFSCTSNKLTTLDYFPEYIGGDFYCLDNDLLSIEDYPLNCKFGGTLFSNNHFKEINIIVENNIDMFEQLKDNKIAFHQQIMRMDPSLIKEYRTIQPPKKASFL